MMRRCASLLRTARTDRTIDAIVRRSRSALVAVAALASSACYLSAPQPVTAPLVEQRAEFLVNDEGRVALRDQVGPGAGRVEGRVVDQDDSTWTLRVYRLTTISGESYAWMGESVVVPMRAVESVSRRDFDRKGTLLMAAGVTGAVAAFMWSRGLFGGGFVTEPGGTPPIEVEIRR
jgi:hypothetical protein